MLRRLVALAASLRFLRSAVPLPPMRRDLPHPEATGPPRFLGNPCVHALVYDPGGSSAPSPSPQAAFQRVDVAFHFSDSLGTHRFIAFRGSIQGFHARCLRFAIRGLPSGPRKTRFRLGASLGRRGPRDLHGFQCEVSAFYIGILLTQALPGAPEAQKDRECFFAPLRLRVFALILGSLACAACTKRAGEPL